MRTPRAVPIVLITSALLPFAQVAHADTKPAPGTYTGEHGLRGPVKLTFASERGIGLYLAKYSVTGDLQCEGEPVIPMDHSRMTVTARSAAKVSGKKRTFTYRAATLEIRGRFVSSRKVVGTITGKASYCEQTAGFVARRK
jgi:hypothetical protein